MSGNVYTNKIVIDIQTLNWTMDYCYSCEVLLLRGCAFVVEWGDGKVGRHVSKGEWVRLPHDYLYDTCRGEVFYHILAWKRLGVK